jgi:hypothetical protein
LRLEVHLSWSCNSPSCLHISRPSSLITQLDFQLQYPYQSNTSLPCVASCRSLIRIASCCFHPHVLINTLDNIGYGCIAASFFCLSSYYYGRSTPLWLNILAVIFISTPCYPKLNQSVRGPIRGSTSDLMSNHMFCSFYVQLYHGCGASTCSTPLCATARSHRLSPPLRSYTAVSARTMAVVLASLEDAPKRICPNLSSQLPTIATAMQERVDPRSLTQQLFNSESLRNIHLTEDTDSSKALPGESTVRVSAPVPMTCDDLIGLCDAIRSARSASSPAKQHGDTQSEHLYSTLHCLLSDFSSLADSFSDEPMSVSASSETPHIATHHIRLHHVFGSVHAFGQDASNLVFDSIWQALEPLFESPFDPTYQGPRRFQTIPSDSKNARVYNVVHHAIHALTSFVPHAHRGVWHMVWSTLVNGKAYGKQRKLRDDPIVSPWLPILDSLEQESALRMAKRLVRAIGARTCLEETLCACGVEDAKANPQLQIWKTSRRIRESITDLLIQEEQSIRLATFKMKYRDELRHGGELVGTTSLVWLEWLRKCFLKEWDGSLHINRWSVAGSALELIEDLCKSKNLLLLLTTDNSRETPRPRAT